MFKNLNLEKENIIQKEAHSAIKELKNGKAPVLDAITNEINKHGDLELEKSLTTLFQKNCITSKSF